MKLYKLSQGNTLENLKHFIYITNEYGKPSSEFIDSFIDNFGKIILNGNFSFSNRYSFNELDDLWKEIEQDCKDNQTDCIYNYGSLFYYIIGNKAINILKTTIGEQEWNSETEANKLIYLKTFIEDFDKYVTEGVDMQDIYLENIPDLIKIDSNNEEYIDINYRGTTGRLYRNKVVVEDKTFKSPSSAASFTYGTHLNGWTTWKNSRGSIIDIYRYKKDTSEAVSKEQQVQVVEKETVTPKKLTRDEQAAQVRAKMLASVHDVVKPVQVQQITAEPLVPKSVVQYIMSNIHDYIKERAIVEITGYNNESQYFHWDYHTGELKYIPNSEHSALSDKEQDKLAECLNTCNSNGTIQDIIKTNAQLDTDGVKTTANPTVNFIEVDKDDLYKSLPVEEPQPAVKHYKLKEEFNEKMLNCTITYNNNMIGKIISDSAIISTDNTVIDIGEYISSHNIDPKLVKIGIWKFYSLYEESNNV